MMTRRGYSYTSGTSEKPLLGLTVGEMFDHIVEQYPNNDALVVRHQDLRLPTANCETRLIGAPGV